MRLYKGLHRSNYFIYIFGKPQEAKRKKGFVCFKIVSAFVDQISQVGLFKWLNILKPALLNPAQYVDPIR